MLLSNLDIIGSKSPATDVHVQVGNFCRVDQRGAAQENLDMSDYIAFPGLVNSHDHLDFNLFPQLGGRYNHYTEWGPDIHKYCKEEINAVLGIPKLLRIQWGVIKNIMNGVTTVIDHSLIHKHLKSDYIDIFGKFTYLHSVALEKYWKLKLNRPFARRPVMIHIGEGTNGRAKSEIDDLIQWNLLNRDVIGVHGIAMTEEQASSFKALVWCPVSNLFLYDKTAPIDRLKKHIPILFGTDSSISASANLWEHLRLARKLDMLSDQELFNSLTSVPAKMLGLGTSEKLTEGLLKDIVIAKKQHTDSWESFYSLNPEDIVMVIKNGNIIYFDDELSHRLPVQMNNFAPVYLGKKRKYFLKEMVEVIKELEALNVQFPLPVRSAV